jgi:hypothetical protein
VSEKERGAISSYFSSEIKHTPGEHPTQCEQVIDQQLLLALADRCPSMSALPPRYIIREHAEISGFPATKITEVRKMIDPTTERSD